MKRRDMFALPALALGASVPAWAKPTSAESRSFNVKDYGAVGDSKTMNTHALQDAIDAAAKSGGGEVFVPAGKFLTGSIVLLSNVTLYLSAGATLIGSPLLEDYKELGGGMENTDTHGQHLIFAHKAENISICGQGTIDGNGPAFWEPTGKPHSQSEDLWKSVISGEYRGKASGRVSPMMEFASCRRVRIEGINLQNSSGWTLRPIDCDEVVITGVRIRNPIYGPNTDGIDVVASRNVIISNCDIDTGDDAIVLKSLNPYGPIGLCANVTVTNCVLSCCSNGFKIGTETHGRFENIVFSNSVIYNRDVPLNYRVISGIALEMVDGGQVEGVLVTNIRMKNVRTPVFIRLETRTEGAPGAPPTSLRNITISNIDAVGLVLTSSITGLPGHPVQDVTLENIRFSSVEGGADGWTDSVLNERPTSYPESRMFGRLPAHGLYVRHAERIRIRDAEFLTVGRDGRPAVACDDVNDLVLSGLEASCPTSERPVVMMRDVRRVFLHGCRAPQGCTKFLHVSGAKCEHIVLTGNDLSGAKLAIQKSEEVGTNALTSN